MLNLKFCVFLALPALLCYITAAGAVQLGAGLSDKDAQITLYRMSDDLSVYKYAYATSNGIDVQVAGSPVETFGYFKYVSPEGIPIEVRYMADELGFHAVGRHLPRPPPIPDYIQRSIDYILSHPNQEDRGRYRTYKK